MNQLDRSTRLVQVLTDVGLSRYEVDVDVSARLVRLSIPISGQRFAITFSVDSDGDGYEYSLLVASSVPKHEEQTLASIALADGPAQLLSRLGVTLKLLRGSLILLGYRHGLAAKSDDEIAKHFHNDINVLLGAHGYLTSYLDKNWRTYPWGREYETLEIVRISDADRGFLAPYLTPRYLLTDLAPFLDAVAEIQGVIDGVLRRGANNIHLRAITQYSPISVSLEGAAEATEAVRNLIVPWRRDHAREMAQLERQEKLVQIEDVKAETQEKRARAQRELAETRQVELGASQENREAELEKMRLENEKLRLEIEEARIDLALKILDRISPELTERQKMLYVTQLLGPLGLLTESSLIVESTSD